jgi:hypothetical protein
VGSLLELGSELILLSNTSRNCLIDFHEDELLESLVGLDSKLYIFLLRADQALSCQFLLVKFKLFLECGQLINELLLVVPQTLNDLTLSSLLLLKSEFEVLALCFENLGQLLLFKSKLITLSLNSMVLFAKLSSLI